MPKNYGADPTITSGEDIPAEDLDESLFIPEFSSSRTTTTRLAVTGETEDDTDTSTHTKFVFLPQILWGLY